MQLENTSLSQLIGIRLMSPSTTIPKEPDTEPGVPISIQLTLNASLKRMQMDAKLKHIVSTRTKVNPISNDVYKVVERSGGTVKNEILRLNASALILTGPDGLSGYAENPAAFHIILRTPGNLAGTVKTTFGSISYTLCVSAVTSSGDNHVVGIPLYIRRLKMTSRSEGPPVYLCRYPNTTMISGTTIPQVVSADGVFQVQLVLRGTASSNDRTSTRLKFREARWAVDELVGVLSIVMPNIENLPSQSRKIKRHTRRLTNGKISSSCFRASSSNSNVEINFDVVLTKRSQALCDVQQTYPDRPCNKQAEDIHPYSLYAAKKLDILVSQVLVIKLVVDEVVLDNKTGQRLSLPAMLKHVHGSNYILQVGDFKLENDPDGGIEYLPQYSKLSSETPLVSGGQ